MAMWLLLSAGSIARADLSPKQARADDLYKLAKDLMSRGDYKGASTALTESANLDPQPGTFLNLAYCEQHLGRIATAWSTWRRAAAAAAAKGERDRQDFATSQANQLESQLLHATVVVTPQPVRDRMRLAVDDTPLSIVDTSFPVPLDPGDHEIVAVADGSLPWHQKFTVAKGLEPTIIVPELEPLPREAQAPPTSGRGSAWPVVMWSTGVAGVAALGVGAGFAIAGLINLNVSNTPNRCTPLGCNPVAMSERSRAKSDFVVSSVTLAAGGAAVLATAAMALVVHSSPRPTNASWTAGMGPMDSRGIGAFAAMSW